MAFSLAAQTQTGDESRLNQYGMEVERIPMVAESRNGIMVFESWDQQTRFWFDIRVQLDGAVFFGTKDWMNPIGNNASIRRARIGIKSQINRHWYGEIDTDFSNGFFELKDAIIQFSTCDWQFRGGNFKEEFSMEQLTSSRYLPMIERPMVISAFAPSRHLGVDAKYRNKWFYGAGGVFFQEIAGPEEATWVQDANQDLGRSQGVSFTGRLVFNPLWKDLWNGIHIGGAVSHRTPKTSVDPRQLGGFRYDSRNATSINRKKYIDTDRFPGVTRNELLWNVELAGHYRGFRAQAEYIQMNNNIKDGTGVVNGVDFSGIKRYTFDGWYAMAGMTLFGGEQRYNMGGAKFTQPTRGRSWGDIELLLRYDYLNLNDRNLFGGSGENYTFGVNYYVNDNVKFVLNYQYSQNDRYANGRGRYFSGLTADGVPTADYTQIDAAKGKAGVRIQMLALRMEIDF